LAVILILASQYSFQWFRKSSRSPTSENEPRPAPVKENPTPVTVVEDPVSQDKDPLPEPVPEPVEEQIQDDEAVLESVGYSEKKAMQSWKQENPDGSLKYQRHLFKSGLIEKLPWDDPKYRNFEVDEAAIEATKWAKEQIEKAQEESEEDKKKELISWLEKDGRYQIRKTIEK
jgi:hypothetical protein